MTLIDFSAEWLDALTASAEQTDRGRRHHNVHRDFADPCQRLFNAIGMDSYIQPHRHLADPKTECLIAVRGKMALIAFDDDGHIIDIIIFGSGGSATSKLSAGVELSPEQWHTVIALERGSIVFEVKQGPFRPGAAKEFASWSPAEGTEGAIPYLADLRRSVGVPREVAAQTGDGASTS